MTSKHEQQNKTAKKEKFNATSNRTNTSLPWTVCLEFGRPSATERPLADLTPFPLPGRPENGDHKEQVDEPQPVLTLFRARNDQQLQSVC